MLKNYFFYVELKFLSGECQTFMMELCCKNNKCFVTVNHFPKKTLS